MRVNRKSSDGAVGPSVPFGSEDYPSQARLDAFVDAGQLQNALEVAVSRLRLAPNNDENRAVYRSLMDMHGSSYMAPLRPLEPEVIERLACAWEHDPELDRLQISCRLLLSRATILAILERENPVMLLAEYAQAFLQRLLLSALPSSPGGSAEFCFITGQPIKEPLMGDRGERYEAVALRAWVALRHTDPRTGTRLTLPPAPCSSHLVDELGRPAWLLSAQQELLRQMYSLHENMVQLQRRAQQASGGPTEAMELQERDLRLDFERDLDAMVTCRASAGPPPFSAAVLWQRASEEEQLCEAIVAIPHPHILEILQAKAARADCSLWMLRRVANALDAPQVALEGLELAFAHQPANMAIRLELFSLLMTSSQPASRRRARMFFPGEHTEAVAVAAATNLWNGIGPFPPYLQGTLQQLFCGRLNDLLDFLATVKVAGPLRRSLWLAAMELHLGTAHAGTAQLRQTKQAFECSICTDELLPEADAALANCTCPSKVCLGCADQGIRTAGKSELLQDSCPTGCGNPLTRQDLERLGFDAAEVDQTLIRIIAGLVRILPDWQACTTPNCVGGYQVDDVRQYRYDCGLCGETMQSTETVDPLLVRRLLEGVCNRGQYRECPDCGVSIEKNLGCNHMTCRECHHEWFFDQYQLPPRIPGVLGRLGFYDNIKGRDVRRVRQRARKWLKNY